MFVIVVKYLLLGLSILSTANKSVLDMSFMPTNFVGTLIVVGNEPFVRYMVISETNTFYTLKKDNNFYKKYGAGKYYFYGYICTGVDLLKQDFKKESISPEKTYFLPQIIKPIK